MTGTASSAIENGKTRLCKTCEARALKEAEELPAPEEKADGEGTDNAEKESGNENTETETVTTSNPS